MPVRAGCMAARVGDFIALLDNLEPAVPVALHILPERHSRDWPRVDGIGSGDALVVPRTRISPPKRAVRVAVGVRDVDARIDRLRDLTRRAITAESRPTRAASDLLGLHVLHHWDRGSVFRAEGSPPPAGKRS